VLNEIPPQRGIDDQRGGAGQQSAEKEGASSGGPGIEQAQTREERRERKQAKRKIGAEAQSQADSREEVSPAVSRPRAQPEHRHAPRRREGCEDRL